MSSSALPFVNGGGLLSAQPQSSANFHASAAFKWGLQRERDVGLFPRRIRGQEIRVLANPNKRRQIEAINGAWAMIGLTTGLVNEGQTGKSILDQLAGYWAALVGFFIR